MLRLRTIQTGLRFPQLSRNISASSYLRAKTEAPKVESVLAQLNVQAERVKTYKPVTPGLRHLRRPISAHLYAGRPIRALTVAKRKTGGRNAQGKITARHIGGGHRRRLRILDFMRVEGGPMDVVRIEYDPGRSAHIALVRSRSPTSKKPFSYILAAEGLRAGDVVTSYRRGIPDGLVPGYTDTRLPSKRAKRQMAKSASTSPTGGSTGPTSSSLPKSITDPALPQSVLDPSILQAASSMATASLSLGILRTLTLKPGNVLPLRLIPSGTIIHSVALDPQGPGLLCRAAGTYAQVVAHDDKGRYTQVRLMSGEVRNILQNCCATIGKVSNADWKLRSLGKAGRSRWLGRRPSVRGLAMNA
ncbi:hypothetical protein FRB99_008007 [Tulasnella sp. 403]|nr:hypothetical protein FRB99_008007 [Tulasnella sp. 403]